MASKMKKIESLIDEGFIPFSMKALVSVNKDGKTHKINKFPEWSKITKDNFRSYINEDSNGYAIITGEMSHLTVIDIDDPITYEKICQLEPSIKGCRTIKTNHGYHLYMKYDPEFKNGGKSGTKIFDDELPHVDVRNDGGLIICPPSTYTLPDGTTAKYEDLGGEMMKIPKLFYDHLKIQQTKKTTEKKDKMVIKLKQERITDQVYYECQSLIGMLSQQRSDEYSKWLEVGICLRNISRDLMDDWIEFSKKSSKFDESVCFDKWYSFEPRENGPNIGSLHNWAKEDDPQEYEHYINPIKGKCLIEDDSDHEDEDELKPSIKPKSSIKSIGLTHINVAIIYTLKKTVKTPVKMTKKQLDEGVDQLYEERHLPDSPKIVKYLNQYLTFVHITKPFVIELTDKSPIGYIFHSKTKNLRDDSFAPFYEAYTIWLDSPNRKTVNRITYLPYMKSPVKDEFESFNSFRGFKWTKHGYDDDFKVDANLIEPWLDMLRHNWTNDVPKLFDFLIKCLAHKIQYPDQRLLVTFVITSLLEGIGKNTFIDFLTDHVIGNEYVITVGQVSELMEKFNDKFEKSLLVCCDELKNRGNKFENTDDLKRITCQKKRNIETKFMSVRTNCPDYNDYFFFTNNFGPIKPSMSDRRYFCLEGNCDRANVQSYWNKLYQSMNDEVGKHFFYYLAQMDITDFNPRDIPMTEWKRELKEISIDPVVRSLINYVINKKNTESDSVEKLIPTGDLYALYEQQIKEGGFKHTSRSFSVQIKKILGIEPKRTNKQRGYFISINVLIERIRIILKDPEYSFDKIDDDGDDEKPHDCDVFDEEITS